MLNTDLHNPNMQDEKRMTIEQFIRNNRGINDGQDLPESFLVELYRDIKNDEIQVQQTIGNIANNISQWDGLINNDGEVKAFMQEDKGLNIHGSAGVHEKDMFTVIAESVLNAMKNVFDRSDSDSILTDTLFGFQTYARICVYFDMKEEFNEVMVLLLRYGYDYVMQVDPSKRFTNWKLLEALVKEGGTDFERDEDGTARVIKSACHHKGLLSLKTALNLLKSYTGYVQNGWVNLMEVLFALRTVRALPASLNELDDFADAEGKQLTRSPFAERSLSTAEEYSYDLISQNEEGRGGGFWGGISSIVFGEATDDEEDEGEEEDWKYEIGEQKEADAARSRAEDDASGKYKQFTTSEAVMMVVDCQQIDVALSQTRNLSSGSHIFIVKMLLDCRKTSEDCLVEDSPIFEDQASFALELASHVLLSNGSRPGVEESYALMLEYFTVIAKKSTKLPYLLERVAVSILKFFIHLYDEKSSPRLRRQLLESLALLSFTPHVIYRHLANRIGAGLGVVLRTSKFTTKEEWGVVLDVADKTCEFRSGRGYIFDGISAAAGDCDSLIATVGCEADVKVMAVLLKFVNGSYQGDLTNCVAAVGIIVSLWRCAVERRDKLSSSVMIELSKSLRDVSSMAEPAVAKVGCDAMQRALGSIRVEQVDAGGWLKLFQEVLCFPPPIVVDETTGFFVNEEVRVQYTSLVGRLVLLVIPSLLKQGGEKIGGELKEVLSNVAKVMGENVSMGEECFLTESTIEICTNLANVFAFEEFDGGLELGAYGVSALKDQLGDIFEVLKPPQNHQPEEAPPANKSGTGLPPPPLSSNVASTAAPPTAAT